MNKKAQLFLKGFSYSMTANVISLLISTLVILIVPKLIGVEDYGYWQLYLFYASYVGFFQFGWNDGIYLRYGGKEYDSLDKKVFFSQFWMLTMSQLIIAAIIFLLSIYFIDEIERQFILIMVAVSIVIMGVRAMPIYILQATNRVKQFAMIIILERILYFFLVILLLFIGVREYKLMVVADIIAKLISLFYAMYICREIVFCKVSAFNFNFKEAIDNITVGVKLMFASIASMLIIGVVRFGIERSWDVEVFGKLSLTLVLSNVMLLFINTVGIIIFPILRRTDKEKLSSIYVTMRDFLMVILLGALVFYYPIKDLMSVWLPKYQESMIYMALVFPMCLYEGKMALLINTYLKTLRKEKMMLKINIISLVLSVLITIFTTVVFKNLNLAITSIVIILAFRCVFSEVYLSRILKISVCKDIFLELTMSMIFMLTGWFIKSFVGIFLYVIFYIIYLVAKRKDIKSSIKNIKILMKAHSLV
ncbi:lipopolysaccharide biosynthesis protein [Acetobacterium sp.]|uniref:lipopolysaccharide biosynthesis protein n=1 Tax=Acetobacterium sp. TaxID=1872094 RepID=UPI000CC5CD6D|nr:oligosaccharide flippase family protein [Acetobacterium sp.]MDO9493757.1 oligosaccharide flippase family protein [Acetobacterium sp.]PKM75517.1 MAG: hypothetical protein CVU92_00915 [Firmicutes bacterium HGW-Firmicutes-17]